MTDRDSEAGFTLLETLVAFVIAALALGALYRGAVVGLRSARIAAHTEAATSRALSRLAAFDDPALLHTGHAEGDDGGGFAWETDVRPGATATIATGDPGGPRIQVVLYAVRVDVSWTVDGGQRHVTLASARTGTLGPAAP